LIGKTLGTKYRITESLGIGGMSEVYKAYQPGLDRYVAIKVLRAFLATEEDFLARFRREAKAAAMLRHPNIVRVHDFDFDVASNTYYMVMEFIDGPNLREYLQEMAEKDQQIPLKEVFRIVTAVANALDYAHQRGTVHRDVKPANIMFNQDGEVVLTDFGIAKMVNVAGLTASGASLGTPAYMAPEQGSGQTGGDERSDIYSLGAVLYQLATGQLPFNAETPLGIILKHMNDPLFPPTKINPDLPPGLEIVIRRAMAKDPQDRYQSAKEFAADLKQSMSGDSTGMIPLEPALSAMPAMAPDVRTPDQEHLQEREIPPSEPAPRPPMAEPVPVEAVDDHPKRRGAGWLFAFLVLFAVIGSTTLFFTAVAEPLKSLFAAIIPQRGTPTPTVIATPTPTLDTVSTAVAVVLATQNAQATFEATVNFTPSPTPTATPTATPTPDLTATAIAACVFDFDVIRDFYVWPGVLIPGQQFVKRWEIQNTGTCTWTEGSALVFVSGDELEVVEAPVIEPLGLEEATQIEITLRAPTRYKWYVSKWQLQDSDGNAIGEELEIACYVGPTPTPTPSPLPTETPPTETLSSETPQSQATERPKPRPTQPPAPTQPPPTAAPPEPTVAPP
jgi:serine/threonine-protein kinase